MRTSRTYGENTEITEIGRVCHKCGEFRTWEHFYKSKTGVNNHYSICKKCLCQQHKEKYINFAMERQKERLEKYLPKEEIRIKEDVCPELTPEMFGIEVREQEEYDY